MFCNCKVASKFCILVFNSLADGDQNICVLIAETNCTRRFHLPLSACELMKEQQEERRQAFVAFSSCVFFFQIL